MLILFVLNLLCFVVSVFLADGSHTNWPFPNYKQCDPRWGNDEMGTNGNGERATICKEGCAMTCVSMAMNGVNLSIPLNNSDQVVIANPGTLNTWLINNNGYDCVDGDCNNLKISIIDNLTNQHFIYNDTMSNNINNNLYNLPQPTMNEIRRGLDSMDTIYIAHNPLLHHFVLAYSASWVDNTFYVNDPFFNSTIYNINQTDGFIVYNIYDIARTYPYYAQCNNTWANTVMGTNNDTICQVGCLMSSISMALSGYNISINDEKSNPYTLNKWLQQNNGYTSDSDLIESSLDNISSQGRVLWPNDGMHTSNDIDKYIIKKYLKNYPRRTVIANVMQGKHFVLVYDILDDMDTLLVNDPGQFHNTYSYSNDVVGWRLFDLK